MKKRRKPTRKTVSTLVTVTGNASLTATEIRREVRHLIKGYGGYLGADRDGNEIRIAIKEIKAPARLFAAAPDLLGALQFYVTICGNTCHSVTRETAAEMYDRAMAALKKAGVQ